VKSFLQRISEDRRLIILRLLEQAPGYTANESLIGSSLADFGHDVSCDELRADFMWLEQQRLVTLEEIVTVLVATLSQRGLETATGVVRSAGVKRPSPSRRPSLSGRRTLE
jgi:hypothetical protein